MKGLVILGIFLIPYAQTVRQTYQPKDTYFDWEKHQYAAFMKHLKPWTKYSVVQTGYNAHVSFYVKKYQMEGRDVQVKYPDQLIAGDTILLCDEKRRNAVLKLWGIKGLYSNKNCGLHLVTSK